MFTKYGTSQTIVNVNSCGPAPGAQRMFSQTQSMMGMGVGQSGGPPPGAPSVASQADMNLPPCAGGLDVIYGNMPLHSSHPNQQRPLVQTMSAAYRQNILTVQQQAHLKSQPNTAMLKQQQKHLVRLPNSMPNVMANNMSSSMPSSIQGALPTQAQPWQQQPQQHPGLQQAMGSQPGSANGGMTAGFPNSGFHAQSRMTKLPNNAPFSQVGMGNSVAGRAMAGMNPGKIMPNMKQQRTNNPAVEQQMPPSNQQTPQQGQPVPQTQQVLPDLGPFSQAQTVPSCTAGLQSNQAYQLNRTASQHQFGYNSQSSGSLSGFPAETELDSLLKNHSTQEWMDDLDELLASHQ
ncbi:putative mastermind-like protein 1 [Triplophysa rosa]|uniref:Mastermind-like protein 1 n=1 Tax=Triplophysa rosa TaxID=992332 RepID=A0A9W7WJ15_TRIRA|nr:putative mastermind-like protein 1 [Triplophysa rosa]